MGPLIVVLIVLFVLAVTVLSSLCIVPQGSAWVVERLGKYAATWEAGLHIKTPVIERIVRKISMKEQVADFEPQSVITKDNVTMNVDSVVYFQVIDPRALTYGVERPIAAIENLCATTLRNIIGSMTLDETLAGRETINAETIKVLEKKGEKLVSVPGESVDRSRLFGAQTPQIFHSEIIKEAYSLPYDTAFTDDASVVEKYGKNLSYTMGERFNIKMTTQDDLKIARALLSAE